MLDVIKSDLRKLFTVRSTYILMIVAAILAAFVAFYVEAWWGKSGSAAGRMSLGSTALYEILKNSAGMVATFTCIVAILQVGHEYRYNTIMYTLTASSSRLKVFLSKMLTLSIFSLVASISVVIVALGAYFLGLAIKGTELPAQDLNLLPDLLRAAFYFVLYGLFGFLLGILLRNVIAAIAVLFLLPAMVEPLLTMLLRDKAVYLPISAFDQVVGVTRGAVILTPNSAVLVSLGYLTTLMVVAWVLFVRRDAN